MPETLRILLIVEEPVIAKEVVVPFTKSEFVPESAVVEALVIVA